MPNKQLTRTPRNRKKTGNRDSNMAVAGPVWPTGRLTTELKSYFFNNTNYQLYHNQPVAMGNVLNLLDQITVGNSSVTRVGNRIFIKRLRARMVFNNKVDRPNVSYRVVVTAAPTNTNTDSYGELMYGGNITSVHVPSNSLLLYDSVFPLNQGSGMENNVTPNKERSFNHAIDVPINRSVVYNTNDGKATTCLTVWFICFDAYATLGSDNIASVASLTYALDYTDA